LDMDPSEFISESRMSSKGFCINYLLVYYLLIIEIW